jgi:hypothetical protein
MGFPNSMAKHLESNTCCRRNPLRIVLPASSLARHVEASVVRFLCPYAPVELEFAAAQWLQALRHPIKSKSHATNLHISQTLFSRNPPPYHLYLTTSTSPPPPHHLRHISQISQIILSVTTASLLRQLLSCDSFSPVTTSPPRQLLQHNSFIYYNSFVIIAPL